MKVGSWIAIQNLMLVSDPTAEGVIGAAIEVHRALGPGLLESAYSACLCHELTVRGFAFRAEVPLPLIYKGVTVDCGYRLDFVVENGLILEIKSVERVEPIHVAQVLTYLRLTRSRQALLLNFNVTSLRAGVRSYLGQGTRFP